MGSDQDATACLYEIPYHARVESQSVNIKLKLGHFLSSSALAQAQTVGSWSVEAPVQTCNHTAAMRRELAVIRK